MQGIDGVLMLGETSIGQYFYQSVSTMSKLLIDAEINFINKNAN